jgi:hypothetical protein
VLLALVVGTGLQVMAAIMEADVTSNVWAEAQSRPRAGRGAAWSRGGVGESGWASGAGRATQDARGRRLR